LGFEVHVDKAAMLDQFMTGDGAHARASASRRFRHIKWRYASPIVFVHLAALLAFGFHPTSRRPEILIGARKPADGYTLLGGPSSMSSGLLTMKQKLSFNFDDKLTIVSPVGEGPPSMILLRKELNIKDWTSFVAYSKANPGKIRYASPGALTGPHLDMMLVANRLGVDWTHMPQKGGGGILKALSNADANTGLLNIAVASPLLKNDEVVGVVTTAKERIKAYPDVPTLRDVGIKGVGNTLFHAVWAPAGTPPAVMKTLFEAIQKAMRGERMQSLFARAEMWGPKLKSVDESKAWFNEAMKDFITTAEEAAPLLAKQN
jgi:tripartite-type tricarboxylate transporter receptor subunit TctC